MYTFVFSASSKGQIPQARGSDALREAQLQASLDLDAESSAVARKGSAVSTDTQGYQLPKTNGGAVAGAAAGLVKKPVLKAGANSMGYHAPRESMPHIQGLVGAATGAAPGGSGT